MLTTDIATPSNTPKDESPFVTRKNTTHKKGLSGFALYRYLQKNGHPPGYQVLCVNCNSAKSDSGICPHKRPNA